MKLYHLLFLLYSILGSKGALIAPAPVPITHAVAPAPVTYKAPQPPSPPVTYKAPQPPSQPPVRYKAPQLPPPCLCKSPQPSPPPPYPYPYNPRYNIAEDNAMFPTEALFY